MVPARIPARVLRAAIRHTSPLAAVRRAAARGGLVALAAVLGAVAACSDQGTTAPAVSIEHACGTSDVVTLGAFTSATLDCSTATSVQLAGHGATYLIVPQFATGNVSNRAVSYTIGVPAALTAQAQRVSLDLATRGDAGTGARGPGMPGGNPRQAAFDASLRAAERAASASGRWNVDAGSSGRASASRAAQVAPPPAVGSIRDFRVISSLDAQNPAVKTVSAQLDYVGTNTLIYVDTLTPANGFTTDQLNGFGQLFDQTLYPLDVNAFGPPSDVDQNGRLIILLTPAVNALTPAADCSTKGYVAGFFDGFDLASTSSDSNHGEIYFGLVPDPNATVSCAHSVASLIGTVPATFLHELQHLISFSQHVVEHHGQEEEGWLDEGMSIVAEELGSVYYEQRFPPPTGRTNPAQLFPDSSQGFIGGLLGDSYSYLLESDTATVTLHSDADGGLAWRGGDWLLLRWLGDRKGAGFYKQLDQSTLTGTANIAAAAGESFPSLFGDFSLALYTDSIAGVAKASIPIRDRFTSRTLRRLYQALYNAAGPSRDVPRPFPIAPVALAGTVNATMVPGTMAFYQLSTSAGSSAVTLQFAAPGGAALAASLRPQLSIFRLSQ